MIDLKNHSRLKSLINHPKFGKLLINALNGWETTKPDYGAYGVKIRLDHFENNTKEEYRFVQYYNHTDCRCCLIGASLINKKPAIKDGESDWNNIFINCQKIYNLTESEVSDLIQGFDDSYFSINKEKSDAYIFAYSVGKMISEISGK